MIGYVSGETRRAVLLESGSYFGYDLDNPSSKVRLVSQELGHFFMHSRDVEQVECRGKDDLLTIATGRWSRDRGLRLTLIALDPKMSRLGRERCAEVAEEFLVNSDVKRFVLYHLYANVLPDGFPVQEVSEFLSSQATPVLEDMFDTLVYHQTSVRSCVQAWNDLPDNVFAGADREEVRARVTQVGAFYDFSTVEGGSNDTLLKILADPVMRGASAAAARQIIGQWASQYKEKPRSRPVEFFRGPATEVDGDSFDSDGTSNFDAFQQVKKQITQIKIELAAGHEEKATKLVTELIAFQRKSRGELVGKSLCDLASFAKQLGDVDRSVELARMAVAEVPGDAWAHIQLGNALLSRGEGLAALEEFHLGEIYGDLRAALLGRAEVLRYSGQKEAALLTINECVEKFPMDDVAKNARASILAHFGELEAACAEYTSIIELEIPTGYTFCGRAGVLHDLGRFDAAHADQDTAISMMKDDPIPVVQKSDMLREQGLLSEALACVNVRQHRAPRWRLQYGTAKARVLRDQGKFVECEDLLSELTIQFPRDIVLKMTSAELQRRQGNFNEALLRYLEIERTFNQARSPRLGIATCYAATGQLDEALKYLTEWHPSSRPDWHGLHVRAMIEVRRNNLDVAKALFERGLSESPWLQQKPYFAAGSALVDLRQREYGLAQRTLDRVARTNTLAAPGLDLLSAHASMRERFVTLAPQFSDGDQVLKALLIKSFSSPLRETEAALNDAEWNYLFTLAA